MGLLDGLWHLFNFFAPAVFVGVVAGSLTKLLWRSELKTVPWARLVSWAVLSSAVVLVAGLVVTGRDGKMVTYGAMVVACAVSLAVTAFRPGR